MPEISRFFGVVIRMYFNDHDPPHFHAFYAGDEARFRITPISRLDGRLAARAVALVVEWASLHRRELMTNWRRLHADRPPRPIAPLD